jgi:hypothetical protein
MIVVKRHAEVAANDFGNSSAGPQTVVPAVGLSALLEELLQLAMLLEGQAWRRAKVWLGSQAVRLLGSLEPAIHTGAIDAIDAGNHLGAFARVNRLHGSTASAFQFHSGSKWSTHKELETRGPITIHWPRSWQ